MGKLVEMQGRVNLRIGTMTSSVILFVATVLLFLYRSLVDSFALPSVLEGRIALHAFHRCRCRLRVVSFPLFPGGRSREGSSFVKRGSPSEEVGVPATATLPEAITTVRARPGPNPNEYRVCAGPIERGTRPVAAID